MTPLLRFLRLARSLARSTPSRLAFFAAVAVVLSWPWLSVAGSFNDFRDAQVLFAYERDAVVAVRRFFEWPLWDPYYCGGMAALGTPQSRFASPTFLVSLLFGAQRAQALIAFGMSVLGMEGFYRFARERTASALGPALVAPAFAYNGLFAVAFFNGWVNFFGFELVPWAFYGVSRVARGDARGVVFTASSFAFIAGFGGTYAGPLTALFSVPLFLVVALSHRATAARAGRAVGLAVLSAVLGAGLSAVRLWPVAETMAASPRIMAGAPATSLPAMGQALFATAAPSGGNLGVDGSFFLGWAGAALALLALAAPPRRLALPVGFTLVSLALAAGYGTQPSFFALLRELPLFATLRYPERFLFFACTFALLGGAWGIDGLVVRARRRRSAAPGVAAAAALAVAAWASLGANVQAATMGMPLGPPPAEASGDFHQARGNRWMASSFGPMDMGSLSCWEAYPVAQSPKLRGDLPAEEYLADPSAGKVERRRWSPGRIDLHAELSTPARLLVNQNWHPGWRTDVGAVVSDDGLLAVDLPAGARDVTLRFRPRSAIGGALVSLASLAALALLLRASRPGGAPPRRHEGRRLAGFAVAPVLAFLFARAVLAEPPMPAPVMRNANGLPMVVDGLPAGGVPFSVTFDVPVRLEGARLPTVVDGRDAAAFELFFRVTGPVPKSVGVFVHLEGPHGERVRSDHAVVASSVYLRDAPRGALLRDAFSLALPPRSGPWKAYVGLWHGTGDGSRVGVLDGGGATVDDGRVLVGSFTLE